MIKYVYLDMDGVLADFDAQADRYDARLENGKIDWDQCSINGPDFWSKMRWLPGSQEFYRDVVKFCKKKGIRVGILSAIHLDDGKTGKRMWLAKHCPEIREEDIIIVDNGGDKATYAKPYAILVDDMPKNCNAYQQAGGHTVCFTDPYTALDQVKEKIRSA